MPNTKHQKHDEFGLLRIHQSSFFNLLESSCNILVNTLYIYFNLISIPYVVYFD